MKSKTMRTLTTLLLIAVMLVLPMRIQAKEPPPPPDEWTVVVCAVIGVGLVVTGIWLLNKKCTPKYYWFWDGEPGNPPNTWVGTCTERERKINGWRKIGGPYAKPEDAPPLPPPITNVVSEIEGPLLHHAVEQSTDGGKSWTTIHEEDSTQEDFGYFVSPTNQAALFRLRVGAP